MWRLSCGNLGPVAGIDGRIAVQIRDHDQTVIGDPVHDLLRLALSLATASRGSDLPGVTTARILEQVIEGYQAALQHDADTLDDAPNTVRLVMKRSLGRSWKALAKERLEDQKPSIPLGAKFWPLAKSERDAIEELFATPRLRRLATSLRWRDDDAPVEVLDAAYWMKGCSSLACFATPRCSVSARARTGRRLDGYQGNGESGGTTLCGRANPEGQCGAHPTRCASFFASSGKTVSWRIR